MTITSIVGAAASKARSSGIWSGPLAYADGFFTNSSPRYFPDTITPQILGQFSAGDLAVATVGGEIYGQFEEARENRFTRVQDISHGDWTSYKMNSPQAATDPLGGATAWKCIPDNTVDSHYHRQSQTYDGSSTYTHHAMALSDGWDFIRLWFPSGNFAGAGLNRAMFDLSAGSIFSQENVIAKITDMGGGWYWLSITATSNSPGTNNTLIEFAKFGGAPAAGDGTSGVRIWNPQLEIGNYPSSQINSVASPLMRSKDQYYWNYADIPDGIKSGAFTFKYVPNGANNEISGNRKVLDFGGGDHIWWLASGSSRYFRADLNNATKCTGNNLTFGRRQPLTVTVRPSVGSIEVSGATTGDGIAPGTPWAWPSGAPTKMYWGMAANLAAQMDGLLTQPKPP